MELAEHYPEMRALGARMVAISIDPAVRAGANSRWKDISYPILFTDMDSTVPEQWGVWDLHHDGLATPSVFIVDRYGNQRFRWISDGERRRLPGEVVVDELRKIVEEALPAA